MGYTAPTPTGGYEQPFAEQWEQPGGSTRAGTAHWASGATPALGPSTSTSAQTGKWSASGQGAAGGQHRRYI